MSERKWKHRDGDEYLAVVPRIIGNLSAWETVYEVPGTPTTHVLAVAEGFTAAESDDFQIAALRKGSLVALLWMDEIVDDDPALMEKVAGQLDV